MINITDKKNCCGCNACYDICPKDAITLSVDNEGFWYPVVDKDRCINCGLCERTCPIIHVGELKKNYFENPVCFAAIHKNIEIRFGSTTGGLFSALAEEMYRQKGYVGGAIYNNDFSVSHFISNNPQDLIRLRQSKYSQSDTCGIYNEVKNLLNVGEKVLICGTPCQMAALRRFLNKDYENLIIVDFICKSITSPKFYSKYLDYWERKAGSKLTSVKFKDKELGWRQLVKRFDFANKKTLYSSGDHDLYTIAYHANLVSRPSCYSCRFKDFPRMADITIADFWGCEKYSQFKELDDNAGTSAVLCNSQKGMEFFKLLADEIKSVPANIEQIMPGNSALTKSQTLPNYDRSAFFHALDNESIEIVVTKYISSIEGKPGIRTRLKQFVRPLFDAWRYSQKHPLVLLRFFYLNFFSGKVKHEWMNNGLLYPTPYSVIELQKGACLELHGPLIVGLKKMKKSHLETRLLVEENGKVIVNEYFRFLYGSDVEIFRNAVLTVDHCGTNLNFNLICGHKIDLKGRVAVGRDVNIRDTNAHLIAIEGYKVTRPVIIENHTWLCSGSTICPGVKVKEGAIVGACSYVIQNVPAHSLVSGHPAKVVIEDIAWKI